MHLRQLVEQARGQLSAIYDDREAQNIIYLAAEEKFGFTRADLRSDALLSPEEVKEWEAVMTRLLKHEPIQYILGEADFYGMKFNVNPSVLIPRPETEELVHHCIWAAKTNQTPHILDIGTGSGCIAITLKKELPQASVMAIDISADALATAQQTADKYNVKIDFRQVNILDGTQWPRLPQVNVIISNPPYITLAEAAHMAPNVLKYEPHMALFAEDPDPLIFYRKIAAFGKAHLVAGGYMLLELNAFKAAEIADIYRKEGYRQVQILEDMQGMKRMLKVM